MTETMEGGLERIYDALQQMRESCYTGFWNSPVWNPSTGFYDPPAYKSDADVEQIAKDVEDLYSKVIGITEETEADGWYGLLGGSIEFGIGWQEFVGNIDDLPTYAELPDVRSLCGPIDDILALLKSGDVDAAAVDGMVSQIDGLMLEIADIWAYLGAKQNAVERVMSWAGVASEVTGGPAGDVHSLGERDYVFPATRDGSVFGDTYRNTEGLTDMIQRHESALTELRSICQRINELRVQYENGTLSDVDKSHIETEVDCLVKTMAYLRRAASYDGYHGLYQNGAVVCPTGWSDSCHNKIELSFGDLSVLDDKAAVWADPLGVVSLLSDVRAELGAVQNLCEHMAEICDYVLTAGPMIGNEFRLDGETGHHELVKTTGAATYFCMSVLRRIGELEIQQKGIAYADDDIAYIQMEIDRLRDSFDLMVDLISSRTPLVNYVRGDGDDRGAGWFDRFTVESGNTKYDYRLAYTSLRSDTKHVCLVDRLEDGDSSCWAGVPYAITFDDGIARPDVYAILHGTPDPDLPGALLEDGGAWVRIDPDQFDGWSRVYGLAFDFGDTVFGPELGETGSMEVVVHMVSGYGRKAGSVRAELPDGGLYELRNTCRVYESVGEKGDTVSYGSECVTSVYVGYDERGLELPKTGGTGIAPYIILGSTMALLSGLLLIRRRRRG